MTRTITTAAELDALPHGVVLTSKGVSVAVKLADGMWGAAGFAGAIDSETVVRCAHGYLSIVGNITAPAPASSVVPEAAVEALDALVELAKIGVVGSVRQMVDDFAKDVRAGLLTAPEASLKDVAGAAYDVLDQHGPTDMGYDETRALAERIGARFGERFVITERGDR